MTISKICKTGMIAVALTLPQVALAGSSDPLRCEAASMRKEGQHYNCLSSCQGRGTGRRADRLGSAADALVAKCEQSCDDRFNNAMSSLDQQDVCGGGVGTQPPDPNKCKAGVLRAGASQLVCQRACGVQALGRRAVDPTICNDLCDAQYTNAINRLMATPYCAGQMPDFGN